ncbi:MAG TPA: hypothetical protein PK879_06625 [Opitutaceae bacterium]|nr:hypothetical protein [Opitutaceae bacterium]
MHETPAGFTHKESSTATSPERDRARRPIPRRPGFARALWTLNLRITAPAARMLDRVTSWAGPYSLLLQLVLIGLGLLSISRVALMGWQWERVAKSGISVSQFLLQGVRVDLIQLGMILALPVVLTPCFAHHRSWRIWQRLIRYWAVAAIVLLAFMEMATPSFVMQYDLRPNRLFVEYLVYPMEVLRTLWGGISHVAHPRRGRRRAGRRRHVRADPPDLDDRAMATAKSVAYLAAGRAHGFRCDPIHNRPSTGQRRTVCPHRRCDGEFTHPQLHLVRRSGRLCDEG